MLPTKHLTDQRSAIQRTCWRRFEINSRDFIVRVQGQAHRQLAVLAMQPERDPSSVSVAGWAIDLFDVTESGEPSVELGCFLRRKHPAHLRVVELLDGGVIARVKQI